MHTKLGSFFRPHGVFCVEWNVELKLATGRCALGAVCRCCARRSALARWSWSCAWRPHWQISYFAPQPLRCYSPVSLLARSRGGRCRVRGGRTRRYQTPPPAAPVLPPGGSVGVLARWSLSCAWRPPAPRSRSSSIAASSR